MNKFSGHLQIKLQNLSDDHIDIPQIHVICKSKCIRNVTKRSQVRSKIRINILQNPQKEDMKSKRSMMLYQKSKILKTSTEIGTITVDTLML